jgi:hypothetical protein
MAFLSSNARFECPVYVPTIEEPSHLLGEEQDRYNATHNEDGVTDTEGNQVCDPDNKIGLELIVKRLSNLVRIARGSNPHSSHSGARK